MNKADCDKLFNKASSKLKTGLFAFRSKPDYVGAVDDFTSAGKGYRQIGEPAKAITSFQKAIEFNHALNDFWAEANCHQSVADIYFYDLKDAKSGLEVLKKASHAFQVSGKFTYAVKAYNKTAEKYMENKEYETAEKILGQAFELCKDNVEDKLIGSTFEDIYNKLLNVECGMEKWKDAINYTKQYIEAQLNYPERDGYRLSKTYMKLCILYIINKEDYLCEDTFMKMFNNKYDDTATDIKDIEKCLDSIKKLDKKGFTYCISSAFTLFENNLLKGLKKVYKEKEEAAKNEEEEKEGKKENKVTINEIKEEPKDKKPKSLAEDDDIL
jgi:tetratricopeptide (TPR) repeat protein